MKDARQPDFSVGSTMRAKHRGWSGRFLAVLGHTANRLHWRCVVVASGLGLSLAWGFPMPAGVALAQSGDYSSVPDDGGESPRMADDDLPSTSREKSSRNSSASSREDEPKNEQSRVEQLKTRLRRSKDRQAQLKTEIHQLTEKVQRQSQLLSELKSWQYASFVLGHAMGPAAAIKQEGEHYLLIGAKDAPESRDFIAAARNYHILRINTPSATALAQRLQDVSRMGQELVADEVEKIRTDIFQPQIFVPDEFIGSGKSLPFVVMRTAQQRGQLVGLYLGQEGENIKCWTAGLRRDQPHRVVQISNLQRGSLRGDFNEDILPAVETGQPFLDYCALGVAQALSTRDPAHIAVTVAGVVSRDTDLVQRDETIVVYESRTYRMCRFLSWFTVTDTTARELTIVDPKAELKRQARSLEDRFYDKLRETGLPVVDRENWKQVRETALASGKTIGPNRLGDALDATHVLSFEVDDSPSGNPFRLMVKLIEVRTSRVLWTFSSEFTSPPLPDQNSFFLQSGRIAKLTPHKDQVLPISDHGLEDPLKVPLVGRKSQDLPKKSVLINLEESPDDQVWEFRPLFDRSVRQVPKEDYQIAKIKTDEREVFNDGNLGTQWVRYITYRLASHGLTPAGRLFYRSPDMHVTLGRRHGLVSNMTLRVLRRAGSEGGGLSEYILPTTLTVAEVSDDTSRVLIKRGKLPGLPSEAADEPQNGDIVVNMYEPRRLIAVFPPVDMSGEMRPSSIANVIKKELKSGKPMKEWMDVRAGMAAAADTVTDRLRDGLRALQPVLQIEGDIVYVSRWDEDRHWREVDIARTCAKLAAKGVTHVIGGEIRPASKQTFTVESKLCEIKQNDAGVWGLGDQLDSVKFTFNVNDWK